MNETKPDQSGSLVSMLYRSRATVPFDDQALADLVDGARERNRIRRITGALFFDNGRFLQWIEGPASSVSRLFSRIGSDARHEEVTVVSSGPTGERIFADWELRLFEDRHQLHPALHLAEGCRTCDAACCLTRQTAFELAAGDAQRFVGMLDDAGGSVGAGVCFCEQLMDVYADLWEDDLVGDFDLTIGLTVALSAYRKHLARHDAMPIPDRGPPIMVMPVPGEPHKLGTALVSAVLRSSGLPVAYQVPDSGQELAEALTDRMSGGLVLVSSGVYTRQHTLSGVHELAETARQHAPGPLKIALYGRLAAGDGPGALNGFDHSTTAAADLPAVFGPGTAAIH